MAELVADPILRQRYRFSREGDMLRVELWAQPGAFVPEHLHPALEERWEVVEGDVVFRIDGRRRTAGPGDRLTAPAGVRHSFENPGPGEARLLVEVDPALELQEFLTDAATLNASGRFTRRGLPKGWGAARDGATFLERYRATTVVLSPPPIAQRLLAPLARR